MTATRPYSALMQSLAAESAPQQKRRKIEHYSEPESTQGQYSDEDIPSQVTEEFDVVVEEEEGPETATEGLLEEAEDESEDSSDPFETHFANPDDNILTKRLKSIQMTEWTSRKIVLPTIGKALTSVPQKDDLKSSESKVAGPTELKLKQKLLNVMIKQRPVFDTLEMHLAPIVFGYQDMLFCERSPANAEKLRRLTCLHAVNHIFK